MKRAKILSASAGSGKTYRLALKYICDVIEHPERYRNILAVTFTNKATEEMKSRILREIHVLASGADSSYLSNIMDELGMSEQQVRACALKARTSILHDFSRFSVLTIDSFFQRILRAFIKELSLDLNYNIEIDTQILLERSADELIGSIAGNPDLKKWLLEYAEERIDDGTRWDMRGDLKELGSELFKENGAKNAELKLNKEKLLEMVNSLIKESVEYHETIQKAGADAINILKKYGVEPNQFKGVNKSFVHNFYRYANGELKEPNKTMYKATTDINTDSNEWYKKDADGNVKAAAVELHPLLVEICNSYDVGIKKINTAKLIKDNYRSFALLSDLQEKVKDICDKENIMVLSKTKDILSEFIDDNNAPFIYEKVGNRYDHYMIDEFQDTSVQEWRNMLPLLKEALSSNPRASVFIVGDIKQSIYRWRGGNWQLLNSYAAADLGPENTDTEHLQKNYRSLPNIVEFNNKLISNVVEMDNLYLNTSIDNALKDKKVEEKTHESLYNILEQAYSDHKQEPAKTGKESGYIEVHAFDPSQTVPTFVSTIEDAIRRGYKYSDILILVRGKTDAQKVAKILFDYKERVFTSKGLSGFNIHTPDALTLESCDIAQFIIAVLRLAMNQQNDIERCIYNKFLGKPLDHTFNEEESELLRHIAHLSPMEAFEAIVHDFELYKHTESIAFLQAMQEQILSFTSSRVVDIQHYLNWWDERGRLEAITVEMSDDTIEITTIHKAKGLERDIVLIPYCSWDMTPQPSLRPIVWAKMDDAHNDISESFPIFYGKSMKESVFSDEYYRELVMSHVDNINLLYVAVTRASKELYMYVPTPLNTTSKPSDNINDVSKLILGVIKKICPEPKQVNKNGSKVELIYEYGSPTKCNVEDDTPTDSNDILLKEYVSHRPSVKVHYPTHRHMDESSDRSNKAITEGINLHRVFEGAVTEEDLRESIRRMTLDCIIDKKQAQNLNDKITAALSNATIAQWFKPEWDDVKCEADIISQGSVRRPDRVMIKGDKVVIVDYKFGDKRNKAYHKQMDEYMTLISKMGRYTNIEGYIWYIALGEIEKVEV